MSTISNVNKWLDSVTTIIKGMCSESEKEIKVSLIPMLFNGTYLNVFDENHNFIGSVNINATCVYPNSTAFILANDEDFEEIRKYIPNADTIIEIKHWENLCIHHPKEVPAILDTVDNKEECKIFIQSSYEWSKFDCL